MAGTASLDVRVLGPLELRIDGEPVSLGGARQRSALALLALAPRRPVSADALAEGVWGDAAGDRSRATLHVYVSNLRRLLKPAAATDGSSVLATSSAGYVLALDDQQLDLARFESAASAGQDALADDRPDDAAELLNQALSEVRGGLVADLDETDVFDGPRARVEELVWAATEARIDADLQRSRHAGLVAELEALTERYPLREKLWGQRMLALYRAGRQADALRVYQQARTTLTEELGIDPGPALQRLEQAILVQRNSLMGPAPDTGSAVVWLDPEGHQQVRSLDPGTSPITVGRQEDRDVPILWDPHVSRRHAELTWSGRHGWLVVDGQSANGTSLNAERVDDRQVLQNGDAIRVGNTVLLVRLPGQAPRTQPIHFDHTLPATSS